MIQYRTVTEGYFQRRTLRRCAGPWSLWALGVGAVISGDFFGWQFGLAEGGFGGMAIATLLVTLLYIGLGASLAEMAAAMPYTGGAYAFARTALGPWGGLVAGLAQNMAFVLMPAVIVIGIGGYLGQILNGLVGIAIPSPVWWAAVYALFVGLSSCGVAVALRFAVGATCLALAILAVFWAGALPHFSLAHLLSVAPRDGNIPWLPMGWTGVAAALPFAVWFYLAIEMLPLVAEESQAPSRDIPKSLKYTLLTLILAAALTLTLSAGIAPGAQAVGGSPDPLHAGFKTIFGASLGEPLLGLFALAALVASFHAILYAAGRNTFALARAGYLPRWLSLCHGRRQTPHIALLAAALVGYGAALAIAYGERLFGSLPVAAALIHMAAFAALIAYVLQMAAFLVLRARLPRIERPYVSPLGRAGAIFAGVASTAILVILVLNKDTIAGLYGCAVWFGLGIAYFALRGRKNLVYSPEESFALENTPGSANQ